MTPTTTAFITNNADGYTVVASVYVVSAPIAVICRETPRTHEMSVSLDGSLVVFLIVGMNAQISMKVAMSIDNVAS